MSANLGTTKYSVFHTAFHIIAYQDDLREENLDLNFCIDLDYLSLNSFKSDTSLSHLQKAKKEVDKVKDIEIEAKDIPKFLSKTPFVFI